MPPSRGERPYRRPSREALAEWEAGRYEVLRRQRDLVTIVDDELPDDPLADMDETRSALDRLAGA